jgi:hypothetical protein
MKARTRDDPERVSLTLDKQLPSTLTTDKRQTKTCMTVYWIHNILYALYAGVMTGIFIAQLCTVRHDTIGEYELLILVGTLASWSLVRAAIAALSLTSRSIEARAEHNAKSKWPSPGITMFWYLIITIGYWWTFGVSIVVYNEPNQEAALLGSTKSRLFHSNLWIMLVISAIDDVLFLNSLFTCSCCRDETVTVYKG